MNFKAHVTGGAISSSFVFITTSLLGISFLEISHPLVLTCVCFFMSLFPDFDTASIPQRWFYRIAIISFIFLYSAQEYQVLAVFAILSITPLLHKHRGWTHWKITPVVISATIILFYDYQINLDSLIRSKLSMGHIAKNTFMNYLIFVLSATIGHYTHLLLDSKFFRNSADHH